MASIVIHKELIPDPAAMPKLCPFNAIDYANGELSINAGCKMCRICVKKGPIGAFTLDAGPEEAVDLSQWKGIAVYVEHEAGEIHPVTFELLGKARELAAKRPQPVYCLFIGDNLEEGSKKLLAYGADKVFRYSHPELENFRIEPYAAAFSDFIENRKPAIILVGGTTVGRSLAPRVAARFRTGLTADCTCLEMQDDGALGQIRPAFGGNIMAHIITPKRRPQFATVRYKIFSAPEPLENPKGELVDCHVAPSFLKSALSVIDTLPKKAESGIEDAEVIVAAGRGIKKPEDLEALKELASALGGEIACTRSLIEAGWLDAKRQIGLSGRTVKPKLLIACGISGAIQFVAGMKGAETILAINTDKEAPIFKVAHYCLVGDLYQIVPELLAKIKAAGGGASFVKSLQAEA